MGKEQRWANQGWLSPLHQALPLAIRMEGNTVDRPEVTLDSSKIINMLEKNYLPSMMIKDIQLQVTETEFEPPEAK